VVKQDIEYLPEVIEPMLECYRETGKLQEFADYLRELVKGYSGITPALYLTDLTEELNGTDAAVSYISTQLKRRPTVRGVDKLIDYILARTDGELRINLESVKELTGKLQEINSIYKCNQCGFDAIRLHWLCPSCRRWNTIKRVHGVAGE
jgi:lipopolysaccharide biosynthesis regulator YciM